MKKVIGHKRPVKPITSILGVDDLKKKCTGDFSLLLIYLNNLTCFMIIIFCL